MGPAVIAVSAVAALTIALVLRRRLPSRVSVPLLAAASAAVAWGVGLTLDDPSTGEVVAAALVMAVLGPMHARVVLGPFGRRRSWSR